VNWRGDYDRVSCAARQRCNRLPLHRCNAQTSQLNGI
jgi:hypothetical protein